VLRKRFDRGANRGGPDGIEGALDEEPAIFAVIELQVTHLSVLPLLIRHAIGVGTMADVQAVVPEASDTAGLRGLQQRCLVKGLGGGRRGQHLGRPRDDGEVAEADRPVGDGLD